ncbi:MAG: hypothetical protein MR579_01860 [Bacteroidales bacterium]|nr:hypothetical protein [Bacteroidales bacterium]
MALPPPPSQPGGMARSLREKAGRLAAARQARGQAPGRDCYRLLRRAATLEAAQSLARPGRCDLEQAARQLAGALGALCPLRPDQLAFFGTGAPLPVGLSGRQLTAALCHLACNSLLYGGPGARLCLKTGQAGGRAYFYLADTGPGLAAQRWFSPGLHPQEGLGLAYCRLAASRAGGALLGWNRKGGAGGFSCLLALPLAQGACPPFSPLFLPEDRFSPYLIQLSPCCILPD